MAGRVKKFTKTEISRRWREKHKTQWNLYMKSWRDKNPEKVKEQTRLRVARNPRWNHRAHLWTQYSLRLDQYDAMLEAQGGVCYICEKPETKKDRNGRVQPLSVDHNHETDDIRKLVCNKCNLAIMWREAFERYPHRDKILEYLDAH